MSRSQMVNAYDPERGDAPGEIAALIARRSKVFGPSYRLFYEQPIEFVRGEGVWLYDATGASYLDVYNNVPAVGHSHPAVTAAVARQLAQLNTHTRYLVQPVVEYAERLVATFPAGLTKVIFTCTGSEAADLALRIASCHTLGEGLVVTGNAYHGVTAAVALMSPSLGDGVPLGPHVRAVTAPDPYREGADAGERFAFDVEAAFADLRRHGVRPAAFVCDSILSSDGIYPNPRGFLRSAVDHARAAGALYIADEVQSGFARTGEAMWGFSRHGVEPDLVILGKPMGNGLPIGGVIARPEVLDRFGKTARYFNTFGGNPVCCAAANAVLDVIEQDSLMTSAGRVGRLLQDALIEVAGRHPMIGDVRGAGLFVAVEFANPEDKRPLPEWGLAMVNALRRRRVLISATGVGGHILKVRPPLPFGDKHVPLFLNAFEDAIGETENMFGAVSTGPSPALGD